MDQGYWAIMVVGALLVGYFGGWLDNKAEARGKGQKG